MYSHKQRKPIVDSNSTSIALDRDDSVKRRARRADKSAKYAENKERPTVAAVDVDVDDNENDDNVAIAQSRRPAPHGCVKTQPLPVRVVEAFDVPLSYSQSVRYGQKVTLSGIWAYGRNGLLVADDDESLSIRERTRAQTKQVFRNIHEALVAAGCRGLEDVTSMAVSLVDLAATVDVFLDERARIMGDNTGYTSSVVGITAFPVSGGIVHVDVEAVVGRGCVLFAQQQQQKPKPQNKRSVANVVGDDDDDNDDDSDANKVAKVPVAGSKRGAIHGGANASRCVIAYPKPAFLRSAAGGKQRNAIAVRYGKEVTLGAIWAYSDESRLIRGSARAQARQTFRNVYAALIEAGCRGFEDVVSMKASLVDIEDTLVPFLDERDRAMGANDNYTSSIVGVTGFPHDEGLLHVEVKAIVGRGCLLGSNTKAQSAKIVGEEEEDDDDVHVRD
jgi:enamine deaminase RidA (YjgF/YER057c/UK114 family)